jgi:hypothetical protein
MVLPTVEERPPLAVLSLVTATISDRCGGCAVRLSSASSSRTDRAASRVQLSRFSAWNHSSLCGLRRSVAAHECNTRCPSCRLAPQPSTDEGRAFGARMALSALLRGPRTSPELRVAIRRFSAAVNEATARAVEACGVALVDQCRSERALTSANCSAAGACSGTPGWSQAGLPRRGSRSLPSRNCRATSSVIGRSADFS